MDKIRAYWYKSNNFGDTLTPIVLKFFTGRNVELAIRNEKGKLLGIGSIMPALRARDVVWGSGYNRQIKIKKLPKNIFLALRGPMTKSMIDGIENEDIPYGDPAILMPIIYNPKIEKTHDIGIIPHYVDKKFVNNENPKNKIIDIQANWKTVINEILSCKKIISSSLHGIVAAEAYGIPAIWTRYSDKIIGGDFKYQDYFLGSGRSEQKLNVEIPPIENLKEKQEILIKVLKNYYDGKN